MQGNQDQLWKNPGPPSGNPPIASMNTRNFLQKKKGIQKQKTIITKPQNPDLLLVDTTPSIVNYLLVFIIKIRE